MRLATFAVLLLAACGREPSTAAPPKGSTTATARPRPTPPKTAAPPSERAAGGSAIRFAAGTVAGDMDLSTRIEGCTLHLDYFSAWGSARLRAGGDLPGPCSAPLEIRLERLTELVVALQSKVAKRPPFRHFGFYGRSVDYEVMVRRVALAAARSPDWDARKGTSRAGSINLLVARLADEAKAYPEVVDLFAGLGYTAHLAGVEKVIVLGVRELPYADWLLSQGVAPSARLPSDFMFGFRISPPLSR